MNRLLLLLASIIALVTFAIILFATTYVTMRNVTVEVDCASRLGAFSDLRDVDDGPLGPGSTTGQLLDLSSGYAELGIRWVRLHDVPDYAGDYDDVFPNPLADPQQPSSYDFSKIDKHVLAITKLGAKVIYRLGYSWRSPPANMPPADFEVFANVAVHLVMHFNEGWANGYRLNVTYWEVWNEPDIAQFWVGTKQQYFQLYETTAKQLKGHDPKLMVGGPTIAGDMNFLEDFLKYCQVRGIPLDFISWHIYPSSNPYDVTLKAAAVRELMTRYGFNSSQSFLTEWNRWKDDDEATDVFRSARYAAFAASNLMYLQNSTVDVANIYRGDSADWGGIFGRDGEPGKVFYAYEAFKWLVEGSEERIRCTGSNNRGFAVAAGISPDDRIVRVLFSNGVEGNKEGFRINLVLRGFPFAESNIKVERYLIDNQHDLSLVETKEGKLQDLGLRLEVSPNSLQMLIISEA